MTAHATKVNQSEPIGTEPQTHLACQNHALISPAVHFWVQRPNVLLSHPVYLQS